MQKTEELPKYAYCTECEKRTTYVLNQDEFVCPEGHILVTFADALED